MKIIQDSCLKIEENILSYDKSFVQLSNISQAFVEKETKNSYSGLAILGTIVGIIFSMDVKFPWIGIGILLFSILFLIPPFIQNRKKKYLLILATNSGWKVGFRCKEEEFLVKLLEIIKNNLSNTYNYEINLEKCTITNSQIGDKNVMSTTKTKKGS